MPRVSYICVPKRRRVYSSISRMFKELHVKKYLSEIGTTDADTQVASLRGKCAELKRFSEQECAKFRKDGALYFKLCVLLGVVAFILIV